MVTIKLRCYGTDYSSVERLIGVDGMNVAGLLKQVGGRALHKYTGPDSVMEEAARDLEDGATYLIQPKDREQTERLLLDLKI